MANLYVMCGLQASGKSTVALRLFDFEDEYGSRPIFILSSDQLRKEHPDWDNNQVFNNLYIRMNELLKSDCDVIFDATNITRKARKQIFDNLKVDCKKLIHIVNTPYDECIRRLRVRNEDPESHKVPEEVLKRYLHSFEIPFKEEGWDYITFEHNNKATNDDLFNDLFNKQVGYNQKCKWHLETLDEHSRALHDYIKEYNQEPALLQAALLHDYGKMFTQKPKEKEPTEMCYYNHENVGAYHLMCLPAFKDPAESLFYINYHMKGFDIEKSEKSFKKYLNSFGEEKFNNIRLFNKADIASARTDEVHE